MLLKLLGAGIPRRCEIPSTIPNVSARNSVSPINTRTIRISLRCRGALVLSIVLFVDPCHASARLNRQAIIRDRFFTPQHQHSLASSLRPSSRSPQRSMIRPFRSPPQKNLQTRVSFRRPDGRRGISLDRNTAQFLHAAGVETISAALLIPATPP